MGHDELKALTDDFRYMQEKDLDVLVMISGQKGMGKSNTALAIGFRYFLEYGLKCLDCHHIFMTDSNLNHNPYLKKLKLEIQEETDSIKKNELINSYYMEENKFKFMRCPFCELDKLRKTGEIEKEISEGEALLMISRMEKEKFDQNKHNIKRVTRDDYKEFVKTSIAYDNEDIKNKIYDLPPYSVVHADEGLRFLMASDWNRTENKELKKIVGQCRTKHLIFLICIPSFSWVDKKYRNDMCNYWLRLVSRGKSIVSIPNLGEVADPWDLKLFFKYLGNYTHLSTYEQINQRVKKLKKHPNVRDIINIPKVSKRLYDYYLEYRDKLTLHKYTNEENRLMEKRSYESVIIYNLRTFERPELLKIINNPTYENLRALYLDPIHNDIKIAKKYISNKLYPLVRELKEIEETARKKALLHKRIKAQEEMLLQEDKLI